jgi:hypothetical protein
MDKHDAHASAKNRASRSLDYLRKRSQHRLWWSSARIALRRGRSGVPIKPAGQSAIGKRV